MRVELSGLALREFQVLGQTSTVSVNTENALQTALTNKLNLKYNILHKQHTLHHILFKLH